MVIGETTVRLMDGAVEHPRMDWLRVVEPVPWLASLPRQIHQFYERGEAISDGFVVVVAGLTGQR